MSASSDIRSALVLLVQSVMGDMAKTKTGRVTKVDEVKKLISVHCDNDDVEVHNVKLQPVSGDDAMDGMFVIPAIGSQVVITELDGVDTNYICVGYSKINKLLINCEQIIINNGEFGGIPKVHKLSEDITKIKTFIEAVKTACSTPVPEPGNGANSAFQAVLNTAVGLLDSPSGALSFYENTKIKHG